MKKLTRQDIENLLARFIVPIYFIERSIPVPHKQIRRMENDAEHSWSVAMLACCLAPSIDPSLDVGKVSQYAIVHDMTELYAGDISMWRDPHLLSSKKDREKAALEQIEKEGKIFPWLADILTAYEKQEDNESKFVKSVDKLITLYYDRLDEGQYYLDHKITLEMFEESMKQHREKAHSHPVVGEYYEEIRKVIVENPQYFYQVTQNDKKKQ